MARQGERPKQVDTSDLLPNFYKEEIGHLFLLLLLTRLRILIFKLRKSNNNFASKNDFLKIISNVHEHRKFPSINDVLVTIHDNSKKLHFSSFSIVIIIDSKSYNEFNFTIV